ncbi:MAG: LacI family DNA-binding transcriptional regulator [Candidatus Nanopelagicales bacterium]
MAATLKDVAKLVDMHPATVSRALNPRTSHLVSPETVARVRKAAESLDYVPNPMASGLRTSRSHTIGVVIPDLTNPLFAGMVRGMQDTLARAGYTPLVVNTDNDVETERKVVSSLKARRADGLILATARREHPLLEEISSTLPIVLVNRVTESVALPSVTTDEQHGVRLAVDHLVGLGHSQIVHLAGPSWSSTGHDRAQAFQRAMKSHGLTATRRSITVPAWSVDSAREVAQKVLASNAATAIVAANDQLALGAFAAVRQLNKRCPRDVSIVGYNDIPLMALVDPPLTTVRVPVVDIGSEAARLLLSLLREETPTATKHVKLTPELVIRGSTAPLRA